MPLELIGGLLVLLAVVVILLLVVVARRPPTPLEMEASTQAAISLHRIRQRLEVARFRAELHRDAETLRDDLAEELYERRP
jgi:hypothetical protein